MRTTYLVPGQCDNAPNASFIIQHHEFHLSVSPLQDGGLMDTASLNPSQYNYLQPYNATFTALSATHNRDYPCEILSPRSLSCTVNLNMIHSYQLITSEKSESRKELLFKRRHLCENILVLISQMQINQSTHVSDFFFKFTIPVPFFSSSSFSSVLQIFSGD